MVYDKKLYKRYTDTCKVGDLLLLELLDSRHLYVSLYNDAKLDNEKVYYKNKIDLIDERIDFVSQSQSLMLKARHKLFT